MKQQLTRKDKIQMLTAIKEGKASTEIFTPGKVYIFVTDDRNPDQYRMGGRVYNREEYLAFCAKVESLSNGSLIWNEVKQYESKVLTIQIKRGTKTD